MAKMIFVGCKIPSGILLQLRDEANPSVILQSQPLQGSAMDMQPFVREDGIGLTEVDSDFWDRWAAWALSNKYAPFVNGFIFAAAKQPDVRAEAKERIKELTKLEGLNVPLKEGEIVTPDPRLAYFKEVGLTASI
jgi:hypothetical protein